MKNISRLFRITFTFLLVFSVSVNLITGNAWATGEFTKTCTDFKITHNDYSNLDTIGKPVLSASCEKFNGTDVQTSIDLNPYIGSVDGVLSWAGDKNNFGLSCYDLEVTYGGELEGTCLQGSQEIESSIDLDEHIVNIDGTLKYE